MDYFSRDELGSGVGGYFDNGLAQPFCVLGVKINDAESSAAVFMRKGVAVRFPEVNYHVDELFGRQLIHDTPPSMATAGSAETGAWILCMGWIGLLKERDCR